VLGQVPELSPHFGLEVRREGTLDEIDVVAELTPEAAVPAGRALQRRVELLIRDTIGCTMTVRLVSPGEAPRSEGGKIQRVTDLRER
jgi:phenylacetate-CoA ligase